jgi:transcriptional regulator with XRE-family HTH domain
MDRDYTTPAERVGWAIQHSQRALEDLAAEMGCTHSSLSQWQRGHTNIANVKVHLLVAFSRATGVSLDWLLTGNGQRTVGNPTREPSPLMRRAAAIEAADAGLAETAGRLLDALLPPGGGEQ